jgi:hypothetical protein
VIPNRGKHWWLVAGALAVTLGACSGSGGDGDGAPASGPRVSATTAGEDQPASDSADAGNDIPSPCLDEGDVAAAIGFPVTVAYDTLRAEGDAVSCSYQGDGGEGFVQILVGPASAADEVQDKARTMSGAEAESIDVGERGIAFGSPDASYAAAVDDDRVFAVNVSSATSAELVGDKRDAVTDILAQVIAVSVSS